MISNPLHPENIQAKVHNGILADIQAAREEYPWSEVEVRTRLLMLSAGADNAKIERACAVNAEGTDPLPVLRWCAMVNIRRGELYEVVCRHGATLREAADACLSEAKRVRRVMEATARVEREMREADAAAAANPITCEVVGTVLDDGTVLTLAERMAKVYERHEDDDDGSPADTREPWANELERINDEVSDQAPQGSD